MATEKAQVVLRGRFPAGTPVTLVEVRDERVLRAAGGKEVASGTVDADGCVEFAKGVDVGGRYFVVGQIAGEHVEVRVRGNRAGHESTVLAQPAIVADRRRRSDGSWMDEPPEGVKAPAKPRARKKAAKKPAAARSKK